jgi:hypothetical protein
MLLADIASGNTDAADVFFLIGIITGALAAVIFLAVPQATKIGHALVAATLALIALAFLLL